WVDVAHQKGAGLGAVGLPEFVPMGAVGGREMEYPVDVCQAAVLTIGNELGARRVLPVRTGRTRIDVLDEPGSGGSAVARPQLRATDAVVSGEENLATDVGDLHGEGICSAWIDVHHPDGSRGRSIGLPQLPASDIVLCREEHGVPHEREVAR